MATLAGYRIPCLGMGTMALAIEGRPSNHDRAIETIHAAFDTGVRYSDTAWSYYLLGAPGASEPGDMGYGRYLVHDALHSWHGPREQVLVVTKTGWPRTLDGSGNYGWQADTQPGTMIVSVKESASHLGVDAFDLLCPHYNDPQVLYEDQMGVLKQFMDEGVAKAAGISRIDNVDIETARNILDDHLTAIQNQFSPAHRSPEHTLRTCEKLGLAFAYWSLLDGFLDPFSERLPDRSHEVAKTHDYSYQYVTLVWKLAQYQYLLTIPSARNPQEIQDSFKADELKLSDSEIGYLNDKDAD